MNIDAYVEIPPGTTMSHDLQPVDGKIEIQIGSAIARDGSLIRLTVSDPDTLTDLARVAIEARRALVNEMRRQIAAAGRDSKDDGVVVFPTYEVFEDGSP